MREFERKRTVRKVLSSPLVLLPLGFIFLWLVQSSWSLYQKNKDARAELQSAEDRLLKLQERQTALSISAMKLSTETGIENEIRDRFQMGKEGEQEVVITDSTTTAHIPVVQSKTFLQKVSDFFTIGR